MTKIDGPWYYDMQFLGYNYRMTDIQAALGVSQMLKLEGFVDKRKEIVKQYNEVFADIDGIITPYQSTECDSN